MENNTQNTGGKKDKAVERVSNILDLLRKNKSVLVLGPRGTGKSYIINKWLQNITHKFEINLLETDVVKEYGRDPSLLRKQVEYRLESEDKLCLFVDEIQKIPELMDEIHLLLEKYKDRFFAILTGSSARKLKRQNVNLLAGRAIFVPFYPFTMEEVDCGETHLARILQFGTLPAVYLERDQNIAIQILKTYTGAYLKEEIMQESLLRNVAGFNVFLELAAQHNASPVNYSKLSKLTGLGDITIKSHYQILEDTMIAVKIPAWTLSVKKQLQQAPKYYFFDNGVINALTGELRTELRESSFRYGQLFENYLVNEVLRFNALHGFDYPVYHYRTNHGAEIDLIMQKHAAADPVAIEIKSAFSPGLSDVKNLLSFASEFPRARCYVLCRTRAPYQEQNVSFLPYQTGIQKIFSDGVLER